MISHRVCRDRIRGRRPPTLGTSIFSSGRAMLARAQPYFRLRDSASGWGVRSPMAMSLVSRSPPTASTAVW